MSVAREDTAGSHQRADERDDDLSSILEFKETKWMKDTRTCFTGPRSVMGSDASPVDTHST